MPQADCPVTPAVESDYLRMMATGERPVEVTTSMAAPDDRFTLHPGDHREVRIDRPHVIEGDGPLLVMQYVAGQMATGIPHPLPGGDPASIVVPPVDQFRSEYVFLVPPSYAFDFAVVAVPAVVRGSFDGEPIGEVCLRRMDSPAAWDVFECSLSAPILAAEPPHLVPGAQSDGTHRIAADAPVGLIVYGFDRYVSYAYAGGYDLALLW